MDKVINFIKNNIDLHYGETVVVGVSGGPDSMALLHLLMEVRKELDIKIVCAHVNHNVRAESSEEKIFVENYCHKNSVIFEFMKIEDYGDDNFHNEARSKRYTYFGELLKKYKARYLFTAHHGDDLMETILMRIVRGSTLKGYSGFGKIVNMGSYVILRPLIDVTKKDLYDYDKRNKIPFVLDKSNEKDVYTRNRFRKYIVPEFKKEDPNVHQKFYKFSKTLMEYSDYIDKVVSKKIKKIYPQNVLNIEEFSKEDHVIQMKIIYYILEHIYQDDLMLVTDKHAELLYNLIMSKKANLQIHLPNNVIALKEYNVCTLVKEEQGTNEYEIELNEFANLLNGKNIEVVKRSSITNNSVCRLLSSELKLPLIVRNRNNGDKISVKGMLGRKKVNDIFIDDKIPMSERDTWPVVVDSAGTIVWIPDLKKSKFDKTKDEKYDIILKYY